MKVFGLKIVTLCCSVLINNLICSDLFAQANPEPLSIKLVQLSPEIKAGQPVALGLAIDIEKGWHTYWKFPGAAGLPTRIIDSAGVALTLGFPVPKRFMQPGDIVGYGYEESVLLKFEAPALESAKELSYTVRYLGCSSVCVPGKAIVKRSVAVGDKWNESEKQLWEKWQARFPKKVGMSLKPSSVANGKLFYTLAELSSSDLLAIGIPGDQGSLVEPVASLKDDKVQIELAEKLFGSSDQVNVLLIPLKEPERAFEQTFSKQ